jgi:hypothetical protein
MHILIPYAAPPGPQCQQALRGLQLPALAALWPWLSTGPQMAGTEDALSPLFERVQARAMGWPDTDGLLPWAAQDAQRAGLPGTDGGWAWITPCHWQINADHVAMDHPAHLDLSPGDSDALRTAMQPYFAEDGITLHPMARTASAEPDSAAAPHATPVLPRAVTWLAQGDILRDLPTASLARACGAKVDAWMPRAAPARSLRRLQNEMQMLLYRHPVNDARAARRQLPVNSFWISGTGSLPAPQASAAFIELHSDLQAAALRDDAASWVQAWQALDRHTVAPLLDRAHTGQPLADTLCGQPLAITLCGERMAATLLLDNTRWWRRLQRRWTAPTLAALLDTL